MSVSPPSFTTNDLTGAFSNAYSKEYGFSSREKAVSKLDVLRAKLINKMTYFNISTFCVVVLYCLSGIIQARIFGKKTIPVKAGGKIIYLPAFNTSKIFGVVEASVWICQFFTYYIVGIAYMLRVFRNNRYPATADQKMVAFMVILNMISVNPLYHAFMFNDYVINKDNPSKSFFRFKWFVPVYNTLNIVTYACYAPGILLYVWIRLAEFGFLKPVSKRRFVFKHILPKFLLCLFYWILQFTVFLVWKIVPALFPFSTLICFLKHSRITGIRHISSIFAVSSITCIEISILFCIVVTAVQTSKILRAADYFSNRSRIVGFNFFRFHNTIYLIGMTLADNLLAISLPSGTLAAWAFLPPSKRALIYVNTLYRGGIFYMKTFWMLITTFVSLPPDSVGLRGWFKPCSFEDAENVHHLDETEPVSFSLQNEPVTNPSIFALSDVTLMLNMSWLAYSSTREELDCYISEIGTPDMFEVFVEEKHDTKLIIADLADRIVIAFRGTKSTQNRKTDLKVNLVSLGEYLPTCPHTSSTGKDPSETVKGWSRAKIHHGFAVSYAAISEIVVARLGKLLNEHRRPVFLTGHSLGGALATVCSLDVLFGGLPLSGDQIAVVTFGSPKCGNQSWSNLYNRLVTSHWRVKISCDMVTMMPNIRYSHVGKAALLSTGGQLILDPSALDSSFSYEVPSMNFHKKSAYKLAFSAVCEKHLNGIDCGVWAFPVSESDIRLWEKQCMMTFNEKRVTKLLTVKFDKKTKKIKDFDGE